MIDPSATSAKRIPCPSSGAIRGAAPAVPSISILNDGVNVGEQIFGVEWTEKAVSHYIDGVVVVDRAFEWKHDDGTDGGLAHVLVNLGVGGRWPGPPVDAKAFPAKLEIDYIRVSQLR